MPDPYTNRDALREILSQPWPECRDSVGPDLCEWDPRRMAPARLKDPYHGVASVHAASVADGEPLHVCVDCAVLVNALMRTRSAA